MTRTEIGDHNTFREYVTIHSATGDGEVTTVGSHNHILAYCHIAHNVTLGNHVIMSNVATLAGHVRSRITPSSAVWPPCTSFAASANSP